MTPDLNLFIRYVGETLRDPDAVARQIIAQRLPHQIGWMALASVTLLSLVVVYFEGLVRGGGNAVEIGFGGQPFIDAIFLGAVTVILVFLTYYGGRALGGIGTFGATLLLMAWFHAVVLGLIVVQMIATFLVPGFAAIFALIVVAIEIYCLVHFLNVLHHFQSLPKAVALVFVSICGLALGLSFILLMIGGATTVGGV